MKDLGTAGGIGSFNSFLVAPEGFGCLVVFRCFSSCFRRFLQLYKLAQRYMREFEERVSESLRGVWLLALDRFEACKV